MDLISSFNNYDFDLITKPVEFQEILDLLHIRLLSGFNKIAGLQPALVLKPEVSAETALEVVKVLDYNTPAKWRTRVWILQEDHLSLMMENLLISHSLCLSEYQAEEEWCSIPDEVQVNSADFHQESTPVRLDFLLESKSGMAERSYYV